MNAPRVREWAHEFASRLDADDFEGVRSLISADCAYDSGRGVHVGPEAIVRSYRDASRFARSKFDEVRYQSGILEADDRSALIEFRDFLRVGDERHLYSCHQRVHFGDGGRIGRIEHIELPGERQRVEAFCGRVGVDLNRR